MYDKKESRAPLPRPRLVHLGDNGLGRARAVAGGSVARVDETLYKNEISPTP